MYCRMSVRDWVFRELAPFAIVVYVLVKMIFESFVLDYA